MIRLLIRLTVWLVLIYMFGWLALACLGLYVLWRIGR